MKKLPMLMSAFALLILAVPVLSIAQDSYPNEVGLFVNPDATGPAGISPQLSVPTDIWLVLTNVVDLENGGIPMEHVTGFECRIGVTPDPTDDFFLLGFDFADSNANSVNIGNWSEGELIVGYALPVSVANENVVLARITVFCTSTTRFDLSLNQTSKPGIPDEMAFVGDDGTIKQMDSIGGSIGATVFSIYGEAVAVENESFGSVKALFR
jgi:hypothetical protein